jgi:diguanylate cyclase (GGDEF)-like protein
MRPEGRTQAHAMTDAITRRKPLDAWLHRGVAHSDSTDLRLKKVVMTLVSTGIASLAIFWGGLYIATGYPLSGAIPLIYSLISFASTLYFFRSKRFAFFCFSQQLLILLLPFALMWSLGGFANGSAVMIWAFFAPLAALFFLDLGSARRWFVAFIALLIFSALMDSWLQGLVRPMPPTLNTLYFLMNMGMGFILISMVLYYFVKDRERAYQELQESQAHIQQMMMTDSLTGIPNRRHLEERFQEEILRLERYGESLSVMMTDVDFFKTINDRYGHGVGDEVLKAFAERLQGSLRATDFLARYGGEEFVALLPATDLDAALIMAERIRKEIKASRIEGHDIRLTSSFGVAQVRTGETPDEAMARADRAMYEAKHRGRDQVSAAPNEKPA